MNIDITSSLLTLRIHYKYTQTNVERAPVMSMFIEGLPLPHLQNHILGTAIVDYTFPSWVLVRKSHKIC